MINSFTKKLAAGLATVTIVTAGPSDIYAAGTTPCVAAYGTTRALYDAYRGPLYQLLRADGSTKDITTVSAGNAPDTSAHDSFCSGTTCVISTLYDQSGHNNHLTRAPPGRYYKGPQPGGYDDLSAASAAPILINGKKAYGIFISPGTGYRNNSPDSRATIFGRSLIFRDQGTATGDQPEGIYSVLDGTHFNNGCCNDFGSAEKDSTAGRDGTMETIYFGQGAGYGHGAGNGPWIMGDLENGIYPSNEKTNNNNPSVSYRFTHAVVKGNSNNVWSIRGGNANAGSLSTFWNGGRPNGYNPMYKEGAVILGIGGDNSIAAQGTWYEAAITSGYPSDATENAVQSNIVAQKYDTTSMVSGPNVTVGSSVSFRATTPGFTSYSIAHSGAAVTIQQVSSSSSSTVRGQASFVVRTGLGNSACFSYESKDTPGSYIRYSSFQLIVETVSNKQQGEDATFCPQAGLNGQGNSIRSWNYPTRYFRHYNKNVYVASTFNQESFDNPSSYNNDASFIVGNSWI